MWKYLSCSRRYLRCTKSCKKRGGNAHIQPSNHFLIGGTFESLESKKRHFQNTRANSPNSISTSPTHWAKRPSKLIMVPIISAFSNALVRNLYSFFSNKPGSVRYCVAADSRTKQIVAAACGILRELPLIQGQPKKTRCWYLCDFKVIPEYRGSWLPFRMLENQFYQCYSTCQVGYGIAMNSSDPTKLPAMARISNHMSSLISSEISTILYFFSLSKSEMELVSELLSNNRSGIRYRSLQGIKDLVIQSSNAPLPLIHVEWPLETEPNTEGQIFSTPQEGYVHMFCVPKDDVLLQLLTEEPYHFKHSATATVVSSGMESDWKFIQTSEI